MARLPAGVREAAKQRQRGHDRVVKALTEGLDRLIKREFKAAFRQRTRAKINARLKGINAKAEAYLSRELRKTAQTSFRGWRRVIPGEAKGPQPDLFTFEKDVNGRLKGKSWRERIKRHNTSGSTTRAVNSKSRREALDVASKDVNAIRARLQTLARTEADRVNNIERDRAAHANLGKALSGWRYVHFKGYSPKSRGRPAHIKRDGKIFPLGKGRIRLPDGPNCLLPGTVVAGPVVIGMRAFYSGEAVKITVKSGRSLSVTPNHPIATMGGFVPAGSLEHGEKLFLEVPQVKAFSGQIDEHQEPAKAEEVFASLEAECGGPLRASVAGNDFHGDAQRFNGDVDIVCADRELLSRLAYRYPFDDVLNPDFVMSDVEAARLPRPGSLGALGPASPPASRGAPGRGALALNRGAVALEPAPLLYRRLGPSADVYAPIVKPGLEGGSAHAEFVTQILEGLPGLIAPEEVVKVERFAFSGHVYDFQSVNGWIVANAVVSSNCKCTYLPVVGKV